MGMGGREERGRMDQVMVKVLELHRSFESSCLDQRTYKDYQKQLLELETFCVNNELHQWLRSNYMPEVGDQLPIQMFKVVRGCLIQPFLGGTKFPTLGYVVLPNICHKTRSSSWNCLKHARLLYLKKNLDYSISYSWIYRVHVKLS